MTYAQKDYAEIEENNPSLVVAFANLLQRFGNTVDPSMLNRILSKDGDKIDWLSLPEHYDWLRIEQAGTVYGTWPDTQDSIILFRVPDTSGTVEHFCLVDNALQQTIVDSYDGKVKSASRYGVPAAWVSYIAGEEPVIEEVLGLRDYRVKAGETAWSIAKKIGITGEELLDHNDMRPGDIQAGIVIRLPIAINLEEVDKTKIRYEVYDSPKIMHVIEAGGTRKFSFGNVKKWADIKFTGPHYTEHTNVDIVAEAHVPVGDDVAKYYLLSHALGKYRETGLVAHTVGFSHKHLDDGKYEEPIEVPVPEPVAIPLPEPEPAYEPPAISEGDLVLAIRDAENGTNYKATYDPFPERDRRFRAKNYVIVVDAERKRHSRPMKPEQHVTLAGTFLFNGNLYGRSRNSVVNNDWYSIPMDNLVEIPLPPEDDLFDLSEINNMTLSDKVSSHRELSLVEHALALWFNTLSQYVRFKIATDRLVKQKTRRK